MKKLKSLLAKTSPTLYFQARDSFQFTKQMLSGEFATKQRKGQAVSNFNDAFAFTKQHLKSYQIESEIEGLISLLQSTKPRTYLEIGTADGGTHFLIRKLCHSIKLSIAIDTDIRNKYLIDRITPTADSRYIRGFSTDVTTLKTVQKILAAEGGVDVLFIDGDHRYEGVKRDYEHYKDSVKKGGLIIFHDIVQDWGQRHGRETNKYTGGVPQFFAEIKDDYEHHIFVEDKEQDGFGIGVLVNR